MNIHRKNISIPNIFAREYNVCLKRNFSQTKKELKKTDELEEKKELKEKVLFKLINKKIIKPKGIKADDTLGQLEKQRLQRFMFLSSMLGGKITDLKRSRASSISQIFLPDIEKHKTPQPNFVRLYRSKSKSRFKETSNPSLIIKSKKILPIFNARP